MSPSKVVGLVWVLFVAAFFRGWAPTHSWLANWIAILGAVYVVVVVLEWLYGSQKIFKLPVVTRRHETPPAA